MAKYQISINERTMAGKGVMAMLKAMPEAVVVEKKLHKPRKSKVYYDLRRAFGEVKDMIDGKKPKHTLDELIAELRQEQDNEVRDSQE